MNKRVTVFLIVLTLLLVGYLYAANKMVIYNHTGKVIEKIIVDSEFLHKELVNVKVDAAMKFSLFSPFDKTVKVKIQQPGQIRTTTFKLEGFFPGEQYNQVEIDSTLVIKTGALGLE